MKNYLVLLQSVDFWESLGLTLLYALTVIAIEVPLGLGLALLLQREIKGIRFFRQSQLLWLPFLFVAGARSQRRIAQLLLHITLDIIISDWNRALSSYS
ncbi:MAG: hypothetical protein FJ215_08095 [Ignavibacteria bacterium]|nr:hypothetical protein [Ignavibacteria bacterium]